MRKFILSLILLTVLCSPAFSQVPFPGPGMVHAVGAPPACTIDNDSVIVDRTDVGTAYVLTVRTSNGFRAGLLLNLGATSYTITRYIAYMTDVDTTQSVQGALYSSEGGAGSETVGTIIADTSVVIGNANVPNNPTYGDVPFVLSTPKSGQTGKVWVVFTGSGAGAWFALKGNDDSGYRVAYEDALYANNTSMTVAVYGCVE